MKEHVHDLVAAAAQSLAGKAHTIDELHAALFQLALDITSPKPREVPRMFRRTPVTGEVLPRHQRATWAREKTEYDVDDEAC